ncbi:MAG: ABC transporter ATP-binding protein [bacterium]|nr:ABC transporter ATP-binding protein [bacterium]
MLKITNLSLYFGNHPALQEVGLRVGKGEVMSVLGPSGSGKSTLLRVIAGLENPSTGQVLLEGRDITSLPPHRRPVGLMFQDYALFPHLNVARNVAFGLRMQKMEAADIRRRVEKVLSWVDLSGLADRSIGSLSGGEMQRVALARSLAPEPALIMLDEPVGALDRALRTRLVADLSVLIRRVGVTVLYVTHDQDEAFNIADRVAILHQGRIRQVSTPDRLWKQPRTEFVARFLGFENFGDAEVDENGIATLPWGKTPTLLTAGRHRIVIRPDGVRLDPDGNLNGQIKSTRFVAGRNRLEVACQGTFLTFETDQTTPGPAADVRLSIDPAAIVSLEESYPRERDDLP